MTSKLICGKQVELDQDGHFVNYKDWCEAMANEMCKEEGIEKLGEDHWKVINFMRDNFCKDGACPTLRKITKQSGVDTKAMYALFPKAPAKMAAKIAGLPKPVGCI